MILSWLSFVFSWEIGEVCHVSFFSFVLIFWDRKHWCNQKSLVVGDFWSLTWRWFHMQQLFVHFPTKPLAERNQTLMMLCVCALYISTMFMWWTTCAMATAIVGRKLASLRYLSFMSKETDWDVHASNEISWNISTITVFAAFEASMAQWHLASHINFMINVWSRNITYIVWNLQWGQSQSSI